jgi:hypothetical protein
MQPMPNLFGRASAVEADHAHLRDAWKRLRQFAGAQGPDAVSSADVWPLILEFDRELREHFAAEEQEGYFGALVEEKPELRSQIERLRVEHREIAALAAELEAGSPAWDAERQSRLGRLLDRFRDHERAEAKMLQDFFGRDEGGEGS